MFNRGPEVITPPIGISAPNFLETCLPRIYIHIYIYIYVYIFIYITQFVYILTSPPGRDVGITILEQQYPNLEILNADCLVSPQEKEVLRVRVEELTEKSLTLFQKRDDRDELETFQQQELAKVKHMVYMHRNTTVYTHTRTHTSSCCSMT